VGRACSTHDRGEKCTKFWWERRKERDHSEYQGVDRKMGSERILGRLTGSVDWIRLAWDRDRWLVVNAVLIFRVLAPRSLVILFSLLIN
jgi:hypothetical protein